MTNAAILGELYRLLKKVVQKKRDICCHIVLYDEKCYSVTFAVARTPS